MIRQVSEGIREHIGQKDRSERGRSRRVSPPLLASREAKSRFFVAASTIAATVVR